MTPHQHQRVTELFHAALEIAPDERTAFLNQAADGDSELRREVESLLALYEQRPDYTVTPPADIAAGFYQARQDGGAAGISILSPNTRLGRYEIRSLLGKGGMGEVYLADDKKMGRSVALKVLSSYFTQDSQRVRRFKQEAQAVVALNHPNIVTIYDIGQAEGIHFIATELIEGETLRQRARNGELKLSETIEVAIQVTSALVAAHQAGVVHRDIKPDNIMLRTDGYVKVLDFGLAKLFERSHSSSTDSDVGTLALVQTEAGVIMGTASYMSPEQARGSDMDARTDLWSLGVVIYEMTADRLPFEGATQPEAIARIIEREPAPLARYVPGLPTELERIVNKALTKDRENRYQTAKDLLIDLKKLKQRLELEQQANATVNDVQKTTSAPTSTGSVARLGKAARSRTGLIVLGALILAAAAGSFIWRRANVKWAEAQVPKIEALAQAQKFYEAYDLAVSAQRYLPQDSTITRLMPIISHTISVKTDPAGAQVYLRRFVTDDAAKSASRQLLGSTPLENLRVARGQYILYIEKDGYAKTERTVSGAIQHLGTLMMMPPPILVEQKLIAAAEMPERMTFVSGGDYRMVAWNRPTDERARLDDYFIDKYEVSNQEYKGFINAGGYLTQQFWKYPFSKDGRMLSWDEAMKEFRDRTGLQGPRSWSSQNFPQGKAEHPVTDITWYEAAAYAAFRGKQLPTVFQWEKAARNGRASGFGTYMPWGIFFAGETLHANFENEGTMPVTSSEFGMSPFGAYNMAGNASEWCLNETSEGFITTGGDWGSPPYTFSSFGTLPGFYTSNKVGFRCALNSSAAAGDQGGMRIEIKNEVPVYAPSSDANFKKWLTYYQYDKKPLDSQITETQETAEWRREKITFNGADGERAIAYLYLPKNFPRPLQTIHFVPHSSVEEGAVPLENTIESYLAPFIKSGRAVFGVVLKG
ncbi:MAG TPA: bifunctional serine/threonine-protein kinase/formylglycine-generating enzyme family protein, partial [Pyrinomonadaceae bacterium]|nr:bifunctional serine/threonine-protein kinase/formylglycine-generating enzyme family protein [Pyrinomonadaceae bacterium]